MIILHPWKQSEFSYNQEFQNENFHETGLQIHGKFL